MSQPPRPTPPNPYSKETANSGIQTLPTGDSVIPSSVRADGTTRKEIKVRPGYKPAEDQEKYRNRMVEIRQHLRGRGVPGAELEPVRELRGEVQGGPQGAMDGRGKNANAKRREAVSLRKRLANQAAAKRPPSPDAPLIDLSETLEGTQLTTTSPISTATKPPFTLLVPSPVSAVSNHLPVMKPTQPTKTTAPSPPNPQQEEAAEKSKKAKKLAKKLRQARDLSEKRDGGATLIPDQLKKMAKISELLRELDSLGYDADGELKKEERRTWVE